MNRRRVRSLMEIFKTPVVVFTLTLIGLVAALLTEGVVDIVGVVGVASALVVTAWVLARSGSATPDQKPKR